MKVAVLGDTDTVIGFSLAGIKIKKVADKKNVKNKIEEFIKKGDIGLIIITESLAEEIRSEIDELRKKLYPIIVEIPDKKGPMERKDPIISLIKRTVGVDILEK